MDRMSVLGRMIGKMLDLDCGKCWIVEDEGFGMICDWGGGGIASYGMRDNGYRRRGM